MRAGHIYYYGVISRSLSLRPGGRSPGLSKVLSISKPVVGQNIAFHAVPAYKASTDLVSAFPAHSGNFVFAKVLQTSMSVDCELSSESQYLIVVGILAFCFALI